MIVDLGNNNPRKKTVEKQDPKWLYENLMMSICLF